MEESNIKDNITADEFIRVREEFEKQNKIFIDGLYGHESLNDLLNDTLKRAEKNLFNSFLVFVFALVLFCFNLYIFFKL